MVYKVDIETGKFKLKFIQSHFPSILHQRPKRSIIFQVPREHFVTSIDGPSIFNH